MILDKFLKLSSFLLKYFTLHVKIKIKLFMLWKKENKKHFETRSYTDIRTLIQNFKPNL